MARRVLRLLDMENSPANAVWQMNMETINFIIVPVILRVIIGNLVFNILSLKNDIKYRNEKRMLKNALTICSTLPPSPPACKKFFNHKDTPNSIPSDVTEVIVSDKDGEHYCYREASPKEGSWGWCNIDLYLHCLQQLWRTIWSQRYNWEDVEIQLYTSDRRFSVGLGVGNTREIYWSQ